MINTGNNLINRNKMNRNLHQDLQQILTIAQCFGILPVQGIRNDEIKSLRFTWKSKRLYYAIFVISATGFLVSMSLYRIMQTGLRLNSTTNFMFFLSAFLISNLFLHLAYKWPKFICHWNDVEVSINQHGYVESLPKTFKSISGIILGAALVEHILSIANAANDAATVSKNDTLQDIFRFMCILNDPFVFDYIPYSLYLGIFVKVANFIATFYWNFGDVFIILLSTSLASKFTQINKRIKWAHNQYVQCEDFWKHVRIDYDELCRLCYGLDAEISYIVLVSFGNNLYFILIQLYCSFKKRTTIIESVYFFYSFGFLLMRTIAVCLFAARINDEGNKPVPYLSSINSIYYNKEIDRLIRQITSSPIALTGKNLFQIKRGIIFSMAGTIVTYELFLLQYNINMNK